MAPATLPPPLARVAGVLADAPFPWGVAGGWALDLAHGTVTRAHADLDLAVLREHQRLLRAHLSGWRWTRVAAGVSEPWPADEWLTAPVHELHAAPPEPHSAPALEFLLNERAGTDWVYRRDPRIRLPLARAFTSAAGRLPVLAPEVVLLYKAKAPRAVDEADFAAALPYLSAPARTWLAEALAICHPGHAWRLALGAAEP